MVQLSLLTYVGSAVLFLIAARIFLKSKDDGKEPPSVSSTIPVIGHILGLIRHKNFYYQKLRQQTKAPIFSVPILGAKIYVVASPRLVTTVQRLTKPLAFEPVVAKASQRVTGCSAEAQAVMNRNLDGSEGPKGYVLTFGKAIHPPLMPGPALDSMNRIMIEDVAKSTDRLANSSPSTIDLYKWLRHELTIATTDAVYGPANPYLDPSIEDAFWAFEENLTMLLVNVMPNITAPNGVKARDTIGNAFNTYFTNNEHLNGSALVQARYNHSREYNTSISDIAKFEAGGSIAILANTFPTAYWMLLYIYSHDDVLQECRDEVSQIVHSAKDSTGQIQHTIDLTSIKKSCPVITATLQEVLRHTAVGSAVREVMEDTLLDNTYLLKKGNTLLTPANVLHNDPTIWGPNTDTFDHRRFLKTPGKKMPDPVAFRAFGGGKTLCPGRHFATTEVLAIATTFIARFDMRPLGEWPQPDRSDAQLWTQILEPKRDFEVEVKERAVGEGRWAFKLSDSEAVLAMAAEDL